MGLIICIFSKFRPVLEQVQSKISYIGQDIILGHIPTVFPKLLFRILYSILIYTVVLGAQEFHEVPLKITLGSKVKINLVRI